MSNDSLDGDLSADAIRFEVIDDLPSVFADAVKFVSNDGEEVNYVHPDHLGAPQKMTDAGRSLVWDASFLPFGEEDSITGSAANDNRFPGQRLEAETGLHYNYFRDYDPTTGRYLQSDPIGLAGGINTYGYVSGNPVNYTDPTGEIPVPVILGLVGAGTNLAAQLYINDGNWSCVNWWDVAYWGAFGATVGISGVAAELYGLNYPAAVNRANNMYQSIKKTTERPNPTKPPRGSNAENGTNGKDGATGNKSPTNQTEKAIRSLRKRLAEHEQKLSDFKRNPTVRPGMEGQPESVIRAAQESRIRHLEKEIQTFKNNIDKLKGGLWNSYADNKF
ncbi:RHS repeat-associated core domain-containing protein [Sneathiella sp.]|uniref:RHS repeat-associated core domain-containing protein n=1 Tax=Sneathiella sp. TaxID=1964365 RepID=UPI0035617416